MRFFIYTTLEGNSILIMIFINPALGQNKIHYYPQLPDSLAKLEKIKNDLVCSYMNMMVNKNNISQATIDSLFSLITQTERVCIRDSVAYKLFDHWVQLGRTNKGIILFFLKLDRLNLQNVEFSEGIYEYVIRIALENSSLIASIWDSMTFDMKGTLLHCLEQELNIISSWKSQSSEEKKDQSINYVHDITLGLPWNVVPEERRIAFLDSVANRNEVRLKALQEELLEMHEK
jgi:hypothetical protein